MATISSNQNRDSNRISDIKRDAQETLSDARNEISNTASRLGERVGEFFTNSKQSVTEVADQSVETIRSRPVQSSLVALGVGVVLGMLLSR